MADSDPLKAALLQLAAGNATDAEREIVQQALQNGQITLDFGGRTVAIEGGVNNAVIVTGDENIVIQGLNAETLRAAIEQMRIHTGISRRFMVGELPVNFVPRSQEFEAIKQSILHRPHGSLNASILRGSGGYGKTTLALALCHDQEIRETFCDGIFFITLENPPNNLLGCILDLIEAISNKRPGFNQLETAQNNLAEEIGDKRILFVIDNVWNTTDLERFMVRGKNCMRLITTRNPNILPPDVFRQNIDAMTLIEATTLLSKKLPAGENVELEALAKRVGKWPLLLSLINSVLQTNLSYDQLLPEALKDVNEDLTRYGLTAFDDSDDPLKRSVAVRATISMSLNLLSETDREHYQRIAIFPDSIDLPLVTLEKLWELDDGKARKLCKHLSSLSLLLNFDLKERTIRLHDVICTFLQEENRKSIVNWHQRFLDSYRSVQWHEMPNNEPYLWDYLTHHLVEAGRIGELKNLFSTQDWMRMRVVHDDYCYDGYLTDLHRALEYTYQTTLRQVDEDTVPIAFADYMRYLLICTSVNSLAMNYPPKLVGQLVRTKTWTVERGLSIAEKIPEPYRRLEMYLALLATKTLNERQFYAAQEKALRTVTELPFTEESVAVFEELAPYLQTDLLLNSVEIANTISDELLQITMLQAIAKQLENQHRTSVAKLALDRTLIIEIPHIKSSGLTFLAPVLSGSLLEKAIEAAREMKQREGSWALLSLSQYIPNKEEGNKLLEDAFMAVSGHYSGSDFVRAIALCASRLENETLIFALQMAQVSHNKAVLLNALRWVSPYLTDENSWGIALDMVLELEQERDRGIALGILATYIPENLVNRVLTTIQEIQNTSGYVFAAIHIADRLKEDFREKFLQDASQKALEITELEERVDALGELATYFSGESHSKIIRSCLDTIKLMKKRKDRNEALERIASLLEGEFLQKAIDISLMDEGDHYLQLLELLSSKEKDMSVLASSILERLPNIEDTHLTLWIICRLYPHLSGKQKDEALKLGLEICMERVHTKSDESSLSDYNLFIASSLNEVSYIYRLRQLIPLLSKETLSQDMLQILRNIRSCWARAYILEALPDSLLDYVLSSLSSFEDNEDSCTQILSACLKDNGRRLWTEEALNLALQGKHRHLILSHYARDSEYHWRISFLASLVKGLESQQLRDVVKYIMDAVQAIDERYRPEILTKIDSSDIIVQRLVLDASTSIKRQDYRALALATCWKIIPNREDLPKVIRQALIQFYAALQYNTREDLLCFFIDHKDLLFTPPIFSHDILSAIIVSIVEIWTDWKWI
jgi:hypothetical protein